MHSSSEPTRLFEKERRSLHELLGNNPNYFGTAPNTGLPVIEPVEFNTGYEELTCVGLWPEANLLEATILVKLPFGFLGDLCGRGSNEYVRFFLDWDNNGDFAGPNEDLGVASVNVHDIPQVREHPLCYAVRLRFRPLLADCREPYIVRLRAILSWEIVPPPGDWNFVPIWGNVLDCWVQVDPVQGRILGIVTAAEVETQAAKRERNTGRKPQGEPTESKGDPELERKRVEFAEVLEKNPNYFGTLPTSTLQPVEPTEFDTTFEELRCIGLYPERDFLEAILEVKLPFGFLGDLCSQGSREYVRFFLDWDGDGDFNDPGEDLGFAAVGVNDIPQAREFGLCYALGLKFEPYRARCEKPYIVRLRAILSWQQVPTGPNFIPVWGNVVECWVQIRPTEAPQPPIAVIDTPAANVCAGATLVTTCLTSGVPLLGIQITGSAEGFPFDRYTLRYSRGAPFVNPLLDVAVVYPNCTRPPANPSANVPVSSGTLGWLDVTLLPPDDTEFTIYLDVFDTGGGVASANRSFQFQRTEVEITAAAAVNALVAEDPFHPGTFPKLIKASASPSPTVPELSIGGAFSVTGSAYRHGCDRILSQYVLARFNAPPAAPVPSFTGASGGSPLITPVIYDGTSAHPWQSGCLFATTNTIRNGNLVAFWSTDTCSFPPFTWSVPKVKPVPFWDSSGLNGRQVILLEVQDTSESAPGPSVVAAVDQVVVWIDNQAIITSSTSIGALAPWVDLHLKDFVGTTAEVRGIAWDPPIDPTAPQQPPNDNFGSYSLSFQKDGGAGGGIPALTPATRVPAVWPGPLAAGVDGTLALWDIVNALDASSPTPTLGIPAAAKLARNERCAYVIALSAQDTTHVGDSGSHHSGFALYAINIINDVP